VDPQAIYFLIGSLPQSGNRIPAQEEIKVIIGEDDFKSKVSLLKEVVNSKLKDKLSSVKYIDLRYKKVYVGFRR
jgi:cell division septal protein FtsQ